MNAIDFINEKVRMCDSMGNDLTCTGCPLREFDGCDPDDLVENGNVEKAIEIVKKWSKEHPRKTRQSRFLEQYPGADIDDDGVLKACPAFISASYRDKDGKCTCISTHRQCSCSDCRKNFWNQEIKDM